MSEVLKKSGHFEPVHAAHAIEQVVFVLQIDIPLDDEQLGKARKAAMQFKTEADLPGQADLQGFSFSIGPAGTPPIPSILAGLVLHRTGPTGTPEKELRIERTSLTFRSTLYTRWDAAWSQARCYFGALLPIYVEKARVSGISLNYQDKFIWNGNPTECSADQLFRLDTIYLSPHIFKAKDLWHSQTGAFASAGDSIKRLFNVNVHSVDENQNDQLRRTISITTILTDLFNQPGYKTTEIAAENVIEFISAEMFTLHVSSKDVFCNLINNDICKRISLNTN